MTFHLHPQLEKDCIIVGRLAPWFILIPEIEGVTEIFQLDKEQRGLLIEESSTLAERLTTLYKADKINIAAIGNLVPQLHVHHVVRYHSDKAWPAPMWGKFSAISYSEQEITDTVSLVMNAL
jgi:diadenosine tetraphosphate (Ap4A) HIT family hydrolase